MKKLHQQVATIIGREVESWRNAAGLSITEAVQLAGYRGCASDGRWADTESGDAFPVESRLIRMVGKVEADDIIEAAASDVGVSAEAVRLMMAVR